MKHLNPPPHVLFLLIFLLPLYLYGQTPIVEIEWRGDTVEVVEGELVIGLDEGKSISDIEDILDDYRAEVIEQPDILNICLNEIDQGDMFEIIDDLENSLNVRYAEPNFIGYFADTHPNDTFYLDFGSPPHDYPHQWALHNTGSDPPGGTYDADIDATEAWDYETGSSDVVVAVLDSGIPVDEYGHLAHPDLDDATRISIGGNYSSEPTMEDNHGGHGTHVAGIIGAETNNNEGIAGICWDCKLLIFKLKTKDDNSIETNSLKNSIRDAVELGAEIINSSVGLRIFASYLFDAVEYADNHNVVQVYPTGNSGATYGVLYPARYAFPHDDEVNQLPGLESVISVGGTNNNDERNIESGFDSNNNFVVCAAPGGSGEAAPQAEDIYSTTKLDNGEISGYEYKRGTSMAAPHVAGIAGLIRSSFPNLTAAEVRDLIEQSCDDVNSSTYSGFDKYIGYGRINAFKAVGPPSVPTGFTISGEPGDSPTLSWDINPAPQINGYNIYIKIGLGSWELLTTVDENTSSYTDNGVIIGDDGDLKSKTNPEDLACYRISASDTRPVESEKTEPLCVIFDGLNKKTIISNIYNYNLLNAYPNPFNPITKICFTLPEEAMVNIAIFNTIGQKVSELTNENYSLGLHSVSFDATDLPSGLYILVMKANTYYSAKKLVLLK